ncbi:MAG: hypothetical protein IIZ93_14260 [Acidaminococcaceae bacterium]|nr:hypothetical protein [Acidaminococcaceae bacterium]
MSEPEVNLIGQEFNYLVPIKYVGKRSDDIWICECVSCKRRQIISTSKLRLILKEEKRKGCSYCENGTKTDKIKIVVDGVRLPVYGAWCNMRKRCRDPKHPLYGYYGGRGITVCNEWYDSFAAFFNYVSKLDHYGEPGMSLDRIDNERGYFPGNVRWATAKEQANNQRPRQKRGKKNEQRPDRCETQGDSEV